MKKYLLAVAILQFLVASCATTDDSKPGVSPKAGVVSMRDQLVTSQTSLQSAQTPLEESGTHIDNAKVAVLTTNNPTAVTAELDSAKSKLEEGKTWVTKANVAVLTALNTATQTVAAVEQSDQQIKKLQTENDNLHNQLNDQSKWVFKLLLGIAAGLIVAGIGVCVASMLIGFASLKIGGLISAGGVALLVLTLTLQQYKRELVIGCGILLLITAAYFLWQLFVSAKANKELVNFNEGVKNIISGTPSAATPAAAVPNTAAPSAASVLKTTFFGDNNSPVPNSLADSVQSDTTQAIVKKLRKHLEIEKIKKKFGP